MGRPQTLLEGICGNACALGAGSIEVEREGRDELIFARNGDVGISIARYRSSGSEARELRRNLYAAARKPVRTVIAGRVFILHTRIRDSFGEDAFQVRIDPAPAPDPLAKPSFTRKQGQYLSFIFHYSKIHRQAPSELDLQQFFRVSAPAVHEMIKTLERNGLISKMLGQPRSIELLVSPEHLPVLE